MEQNTSFGRKMVTISFIVAAWIVNIGTTLQKHTGSTLKYVASQEKDSESIRKRFMLAQYNKTYWLITVTALLLCSIRQGESIHFFSFQPSLSCKRSKQLIKPRDLHSASSIKSPGVCVLMKAVTATEPLNQTLGSLTTAVHPMGHMICKNRMCGVQWMWPWQVLKTQRNTVFKNQICATNWS